MPSIDVRINRKNLFKTYKHNACNMHNLLMKTEFSQKHEIKSFTKWTMIKISYSVLLLQQYERLYIGVMLTINPRTQNPPSQ